VTASDLLTGLVRVGAVLKATPERALHIKAPRGTLTPDLLATLQGHKPELLALLGAWDEDLAHRLLQAVLHRVAAGYLPTWRRRFYDDAPSWLEVEARIEAAVLVRDMAAFIRALVEYQAFALQTFTAWAQQEEARR
jgi:hypothetical protein